MFPIAFPDDKVLYVYMGDRWNPYGPGSVANATYLWLPLQPRQEDDGFFIEVCCVQCACSVSITIHAVGNNVGCQRLRVCHRAST